jgi:NUMOD4 motif
MTEQWLPVVGFEGLFEVSNTEQIRSVPRVIIRRNGMLYMLDTLHKGSAQTRRGNLALVRTMTENGGA